MFDSVFPAPPAIERGRENKDLERRNELQMLLFQRYEARHNVAVDTSPIKETRDTNQLFTEWYGAFGVRFAPLLEQHPEWLTKEISDEFLEEIEQSLYPSH